ncbi:Bacteroides conjugative transposon TraJ protein [Pedobacter steynii]|uniref:Bacteroides conjugative transposon TraJ protein n=1 Tax=Pedobacter steynii TaxID=430522 RepID=A0A1H0G5T2_9SPHI|nr:conjugative transposon protein TraJ [Pedobacter steynii]NQX42331.1 conjugative transposon protein TraJ [Pedobacter steynii]SDO02220.1 Bacteroides conjugative transposon TraJ protein [Pedobacter steynii]
MKHKLNLVTVFFTALAMLFALPAICFGQSGGLAGSISGMQPVLDNVYNDMLPLCGKLIGVARGLAGFGALWYISSRVWRQIAAAEAVDFYPLLRPFALGMAVMLFPMVISVMNGGLQPVVTATGSMVKDSDKAIAALLKQKEQAVKKSKQWQMYVGESGNGDSDKWYRFTHPKDPERTKEGIFEGLGNDVKFWMDKNYYNFRNSIKQWMSEILQVLFAAAALCINTIRTFYLIVLAILGPLVFGFAVFDGFQHTLTVWIARYVNIFMWLPVANIFGSILGKIQENMLKIDISQIGNEGDTFFSTQDTAYLVFLVIGIVGYFTVPNVANYIIHAGGGNAMLSKVNSLVTGGSSNVMGAAQGGAGMIVDRFDNARSNLAQGIAEASGNDYFKDKVSGK